MIGLRACGHFLHFNMGGKAGRKRVLATLLREGEISQRTLQDLLDIQSGSLSEILAKIEADGLLEGVCNSAPGPFRNVDVCNFAFNASAG